MCLISLINCSVIIHSSFKPLIRLINREMSGDELEEKMEIVKKLEDVSDYLKDALGRGIEF